MTKKERFANALARKPVDYVPCQEWAWDDTVARWTKEGHLKPGEDVVLHFKMDKRSHGWLNDIANLDFKETILEETEDTILKLDGNCATLRWPKGHSGTPEHVAFAVKDRAGWEEKIKPFVAKFDRRRIPFEGYRAERRLTAKNQEYLTCDVTAPFELMFRICGHENLLMGMADDPDWIRDMVTTYTDMIINHHEALFAEEGLPDGVYYREDMGYKQRTFMSPAMYREILKPAHRRLFDFAHSKGLTVLVHSCGYVKTLIPDLIDAGMDCLHPIEVKAGMDLVELFKDFGQKISFFGGIDCRALIENDRAWIERELSRIPSLIDNGGGYILRSDHSIPPQVDYETMRFFIERGREVGTPG